MKKLLSILLCAVLVISISACSTDGGSSTSSEAPSSQEPAASQDANDDDNDSEPAETEPGDLPVAQGVDGLNIGICIYRFDDNFMTLYRQELQRYLEGGGASVQVMDGKNDQAEQTNQINNFLTQGVDVLIVNLVQASAAPQITDLCAAQNVPVVFINREPDADEEARWSSEGIKATYVGADARQSGTYQGEIIASLPNNGDADGDGVVRYVMIMGDPENVDAQYRTEFSVKALVDAGLEVEELFQQRGDWDQTKGQELAANALAAHGAAIDVIFCNNDSMAMGALQAIEAANRVINEDIYLVGVDALAEALQAIQENRMTGTVFNDHISQARKAADVAAQIKSQDADATYSVDYVKVTPDNAQEILDLING